MIIGKTDVVLQFNDEAISVNSNWAAYCLDGKASNKFIERAKGIVDGTQHLIWGLNESAMKRHIRDCDVFSRDEDDMSFEMLNKKFVFKGTAFGRTYNIFSASAALLKVSLPEGTIVKSHVFHTWDSRAFEKYIVKVTQTVGC